MESDPDRQPVGRTPEAELDEVRRAALRPHVDFPDAPAWTWPACGVAAGLYTWSFALPAFPGLLLLAASIGACFAVVAHITRLRGIFPEFSTMPPPLKREVIVAWVLVGVLVPVVIVIAQLTDVAIAAIVAGLAFTAILYLHQRRYDTIARRLRVELTV